MVTLMSIACGFGSIVISVDNARIGAAHDYRLAAILLVLAGVFDALDGLAARATNTTSDFGMQLDSIADVMNFGCAPGLLLYCYGFVQLGTEMPTLLRLGGIASFFFVACGALRLARFNVTAEMLSDGGNKVKYFEGTPIPTSIIPVFVMALAAWSGALRENLWFGSLELGGFHFHPLVLMFAVSGSLMISRIRIPKP